MNRFLLLFCAALFLAIPASFAAPAAEEEKPESNRLPLIPRSVIPDFFKKDAGDGDDAETASEAEEPPPPIQRNFDDLPAPVAETRNALMEAARNGDLEALRDLLEKQEEPTQLSFGGEPEDPITFLRNASGDEDGFEILAILLEVLEAGYVHLGGETSYEIYVWPYFIAYPLDKLSPSEKVELFQILTAGDLQDSMEFGAYIFYRVGITPDGSWSFFVAGD